jgi:hypothetical protein
MLHQGPEREPAEHGLKPLKPRPKVNMDYSFKIFPSGVCHSGTKSNKQLAFRIVVYHNTNASSIMKNKLCYREVTSGRGRVKEVKVSMHDVLSVQE